MDSINNIVASELFTDVELLGHRFYIGTEAAFNRLIFDAVVARDTQPLCLANHNLNSLAICLRDSSFRDYYDSVKYIWLDGMPVVWMLKLQGVKLSSNYRLTFLDWQHSFFTAASEKRLRIFLLGSHKEVNQRAVGLLQNKYPNAHFSGLSGFFDSIGEGSLDDKAVVSKINQFKTDLLLVGMGMPRQEIWINRNKDNLSAAVVLPLGGYFDYIAGETYTPPRWSGRYGLEWAFRLVADPRKLMKRYLIEPWPVLFAFALSWIKSSR